MEELKNQITLGKPRRSDSKKIAELRYSMIQNDVKKLTPSICQFSDLPVTRGDVEKSIQEMIEDPDHDIVVAYVDGKVAGFISLCLEGYPDDLIPAPYTTIEYLEVNPEYQQIGLGQKLMEEAEKIAREKNHQYLELQVWETNKKAIGLYEKNHFIPIERRMVKKL